VVYDSTFVGTSVTIKLVLVYVKVTTPPETVLVSVIGQREVEVVYTTFTALVVTAGRVVYASMVVGMTVSTTEVVV